MQDRLEFERRLGIMEGKIPVAQMDIMDGKFVKNTTFSDPKIAARYQVDYELDLMVADPGPVLEKWHDTLPPARGEARLWRQPPPIKGGGKVVRAFVHAEIKKPLASLLEKIKSYGWEAGIALNPDTGWEVVEPYIARNPSRPPLTLRGGETVDSILFMTVYPGQNGAAFQPKVIPKITQFHKAYPKIIIEVDGGVNEKTLPRLLTAGVTRFAVGSAIWSAPDPVGEYKKLFQLTNNSLI